MAPERGLDLVSRRADSPLPDASGPCPFCPGNEHLNPEEIAVTPDGDMWRVRVTPAA